MACYENFQLGTIYLSIHSYISLVTVFITLHCCSSRAFSMCLPVHMSCQHHAQSAVCKCQCVTIATQWEVWSVHTAEVMTIIRACSLIGSPQQPVTATLGQSITPAVDSTPHQPTQCAMAHDVSTDTGSSVRPQDQRDSAQLEITHTHTPPAI